MKLIYNFLLGMMIILFSFQKNARAQAECGFDRIFQEQMAENPEFRKSVVQADSAWSVYAMNRMNSAGRITLNGADTVYEIPVVFHVFHTGDSIGTLYNPTDSALIDWIDYLNDVYSGSYPGYPAAGSGGTSLPIKFVLAKRDPYCNPTNGIERYDLSGYAAYVSGGLQYSTGAPGVDNDTFVSLAHWPIEEYYNFYIVNKINGQDGITPGSGPFTVGFAYLGTSFFPYIKDGAYMLASSMMIAPVVLPHEIGHAFGLYHTFNGATGTTCPSTTASGCTVDNDKVCDTDPTISLIGTCKADTAINTCTSLPFGLNGVQNNIMTYTNCPNHFTDGQAARMLFLLPSARPNLIRSFGALPPDSANYSPIASCSPSGIINPGVPMGPCNIFLDSIQYYSLALNSSSPSPKDQFYVDHTTNCNLPVHTSLTAAIPYSLMVSTKYITNQDIKVYIDYDNDGDLTDAGELVMDTFANLPGVYSVTITPPASAVQNIPLRMRVVAGYMLPPLPCDSLLYGQAEDFSVTVLPNPLLSLHQLKFEGKAMSANEALLSWNVQDETERITAFELERSSDGQNFIPAAYLSAIQGQHDYQYHDFVNLQNQIYYYRLKVLISNERTPVYSKVIPVNLGASESQSIKIFPNPVSHILTIQSAQDLAVVNIFDISGKMIAHSLISNSGNKKQEFDFSTLPSGIYLLQAIDINGKMLQQKITKN